MTTPSASTSLRLIAALALLSACAAPPPPPAPAPPVVVAPPPAPVASAPVVPEVQPVQVSPEEIARADFNAGVRSYQEGRYAAAMKYLNNALSSPALVSADQVVAYKLLAFIDCSSNRKIECRRNFDKALAIQPGFELAKSEAGHPIWGPIFQEAKVAAQGKKPVRKAPVKKPVAKPPTPTSN
ncbi:MAG: TssQ family T6SS-associated lipoprotein [Betaproteobacteria bacterium]|nr:TssQ family T6SS-associated lipoprotein [Betaproteobacteria bacterium]